MSGNKSEFSYVNPMTLEAQWFLQTMELMNKNFSQIDLQLCKVLQDIVKSIEIFLDKDPVRIAKTESTEIVVKSDLESIKRLFICTKCGFKEIGKNIFHAVNHLSKNHMEQNGQDLIRQCEKELSATGKNKKPKKLKKLSKKAKLLVTSSGTNLQSEFNEPLKISEKLKILPDYKIIETELAELVEPLFPGKMVRAYKFGSRLNGTGTCCSDLDIYLDIDNQFNNFEDRGSQKTLNHIKILDHSFRNSKKWKRLALVDGARVPIIKVRNLTTNIECDIGVSNSLGYCNTKLLDFLFSLQPLSRYMSLFLKKWIERCALNVYISTYALNLMIIYFLQSKKSLPSIESLQINLAKPVLVGPWIVNYMDDGTKLKSLAPIIAESIIQEFFTFYATFNYRDHVICPYFGLPSTKVTLIEKAMPVRYMTHVQNSKGNGLELTKPIIVQDPIQLNHNVSKSCTKRQLDSFVSYCQQSSELLNSILPKKSE